MSRFLLALLSIFVCLTSAYAEDLKMPKEYLGWWGPYSKTTNGYGINFLPNGTAYFKNEKDKSYQDLMNYAVLDVSDQSVFLLVSFTSVTPEPSISTNIWEISQKDDAWTDSFRFLTRKAYDCGLTLSDFIAYIEKPVITSLPARCKDYKNLSYVSQITYSRRK